MKAKDILVKKLPKYTERELLFLADHAEKEINEWQEFLRMVVTEIECREGSLTKEKLQSLLDEFSQQSEQATIAVPEEKGERIKGLFEVAGYDVTELERRNNNSPQENT